MESLKKILEEEELRTAAFYARQVVDRETYEEIKSVRQLPDYRKASSEEMIGLATGVLNGEFRHAVEDSTYDEEKWTTGDFIEHALKLSGEPLYKGSYLEQTGTTQLGDREVDIEERRREADDIFLSWSEEPPEDKDIEPEEDHYWLTLTIQGDDFYTHHQAYLPMEELEDHEGEDPELDEWP